VHGKTKVVRLIARLNVGGPAIHTVLLTRGLNSERFESVLVHGVVSPGEGDMGYLAAGLEDRSRCLPSLQREIRFWADLKSLVGFVRILRKEDPDIVHTHTAKAGAVGRLAVLVNRLAGGKCPRTVHTFHGHVFAGYFGASKSKAFLLLERRLARTTDVICTVSPSQKKEIVFRYRVAPEDKVRVVPLGFDLEPFAVTRGQREASPGGSTFRVAVVGRLTAIKNHRMFLEAAKIFLDRSVGIQAEFSIVGDGELRGALQEQARDLGVARRVHFPGWVRDMPGLYRTLDLVVLTSDNEGTPVTLIEAMACGVPVAATDVGGVADLLGRPVRSASPGGCLVCERGLLCRPRDPAGLAAAMEDVLHHRAEAAARADAARGYAEATYSRRRLLRDMEALYDGLVENTHSPHTS